MSHFTLIAKDIDVAPLLAELDANPSLWNDRPERRTSTSPHRDTSDVWVRYAAPEATHVPNFVYEPHESVWWPAYRKLASLPHIISQIMDALGGDLRLGGVLLTRIPGGKEVFWHNDRGAWHAHFYDLKVWLPLRANERCINHVENESMTWRAGDAWHHDNLLEHRVENRGETERICLITCFKRLT